MIFAAGLVVAVAAVGAAAQDLSSLSSSCQTAVTGILTGPASTCLGVGGLMSVAMTPANESFVAPINNWLTSTCSQPACTNATIDSLITNVTTGCSTDLSTAGVTSSDIESVKTQLENLYPIGREIACLQDKSNANAYCVTTTLKAIESYIGQPLSLNTISAIAPKLAASGGEVPKDLVCTSCVQAAYGILKPYMSNSDIQSVDSYFSGVCGSTFTNGTTPTNIIQTASTATAGSSTASGGAMSLNTGVLGSVVAAMLGVAGAVMIVL